MREVDGDSRIVPFDVEDFRLLLNIGADCRVCGPSAQAFNDLAVRKCRFPTSLAAANGLAGFVTF